MVALVALAARRRRLLAAQSLTVRAAGDMLQVRGTGLRLIEGVVADHLKDGRSVRVDFEMTILDKAQGAADHAEPPVVHPELRPVGAALRGDARRRRAAIDLASRRPRRRSLVPREHGASRSPRSAASRATCRSGSASSTASRIEPPPAADTESPFTLRTLIEALSRRRADEALARSFDAGPFRIGNLSACSSLRNRLIAAFLVATLLPLGATIWITTSLLERSLGYATTEELDGLSRTLEATMRQFYERERRSLKQDAAAARVAGDVVRHGRGRQPRPRRCGRSGTAARPSASRCRAPAATASTT